MSGTITNVENERICLRLAKFILQFSRKLCYFQNLYMRTLYLCQENTSKISEPCHAMSHFFRTNPTLNEEQAPIPCPVSSISLHHPSISLPARRLWTTPHFEKFIVLFQLFFSRSTRTYGRTLYQLNKTPATYTFPSVYNFDKKM